MVYRSILDIASYSRQRKGVVYFALLIFVINICNLQTSPPSIKVNSSWNNLKTSPAVKVDSSWNWVVG